MTTCLTRCGLTLGLCVGLVLFVGGCGSTEPTAEKKAENTTGDADTGKPQPN
jgi:hypothetical protein